MVDLDTTKSVKGYCWGENPSNSKIQLLTGFDILAESVNLSPLAKAMQEAKDCSYMPKLDSVVLHGIHTAQIKNSPSNGIG